jgi:hypothetical protein
VIPEGFVEALILYADVGDEGADEIKAQFNALYDSMKAGNGKQLVNTAINGKNFGFQVSMTVEEAFSCYAKALKEIDGTLIPITYAGFYGITR